jgi:hypothetical protein
MISDDFTHEFQLSKVMGYPRSSRHDFTMIETLGDYDFTMILP